MKSIILSALAVTAIAGTALGQQGNTWTFTGLTSTPIPTSVPVANTTPAGASALLPGSLSGISRGAGLVGVGAANRFNASGFASGSTLTLSNNDYFEFTYTAPANGGVRFGTTAQLSLQRSNATSSPTSARWYFSVDGGTTFNTWGTAYTLSNTSATVVADRSPLSSQAVRASNGATVIWRLYGWNSSNSASTMSINGLNLLSRYAYSNDVDGGTWDRLASPGSASVDASTYSFLDPAGYQTALSGTFPIQSTTFLASQATGPTTLVAGTDFTFSPATRVLTLLDTANVVNGTYTFSYSPSATYLDPFAGNAPTVDLADTGTITITVVPTPGAIGLAGAGLLMAARRRRA